MNSTDILQIHGTNLYEITSNLLSNSKLEEFIPNKNSTIIIKPDIKYINNTLYSTSPVILTTIIKYLQDNNFTNINLALGSLIDDDLEQLLITCKYDKIVDKLNIPVYGLKDKDYTTKTIGGIEYKLIDKVINADFFINLVTSSPNEKTILHNALQAMQNILHTQNRSLFTTDNFYKAICFLNYLIKANFTLVEIDSLSDIQADKHMYATIDNLLADAYYAQNLGYKPFDIEYIELASKLNIGCADINKANIINLIDNTVTCDNNSKLASHINASSPCEQCYQNLLQALSLLDKDNLLDKLPTKLFIGQGWREFSENGIGIGRCTSKFENYVRGCPPSPQKTYEFLKEFICNNQNA